MPVFKSKKKTTSSLEKIILFGFHARHGFKQSFAIAEGNALTRSLSILPSNKLTPTDYLKKIKEVAKENKWKVEFYSEAILKKKKAGKQFSKISKLKFFKPIPRLKFGYACRNLLSASIDSSDGLASCLQELSINSKKRFVITEFPVNNDVKDFAKNNKLDLKDIILNGGEEFELVCTVPKRNLEKVQKIAKKLRIKLYEIGFVTNGKHVIFENGVTKYRIKDIGWVHFL